MAIHASGRLAQSRDDPDNPVFPGDQQIFENETADLAFRWQVRSIRTLAADPMWADAESASAVELLKARRPDVAIARAVFVQASPPHLLRPIIEIDILVQNDEQLSQLRSLCELALGATHTAVNVALEIMGPYGPNPPGPGIGVPRPTIAAFLSKAHTGMQSTYVYGWFESLAVLTPDEDNGRKRRE